MLCKRGELHLEGIEQGGVGDCVEVVRRVGGCERGGVASEGIFSDDQLDGAIGERHRRRSC